MIFTGYVPLRRGLLEHLQDGRLTLLEYCVLTVLIMLADKSTGSGTINANTLGSFIGEGLDYQSDIPRHRQRGKQRVLQSLSDKGYIYRQIVPHSKRAYRYWVNKYVLTDGPHKSRRLDLSQVFKSQDIADLRYTGSVAEGVAETVAEGVASNKKREKKIEKTSSITMTPSVSASVNASLNETETESAKQSMCEPRPNHGTHHGTHHGTRQETRHDTRHVFDTPVTDAVDVLPVLVAGDDPYYKDPQTGARLTWEVAQRLIAEINMQKGADRQ